MIVTVDKKHGKIVNSVLIYAELPLKVGGKLIFNPTDEIFLLYGWKKIIDNPPTSKRGYHVEQDGFDETETQIIIKYKQVEDSVHPVRTFRRSYIAQWIREKGYWNEFKELIAQSDDLQFMWETSTEFDSNHPMWEQALLGVQQAFGFTDEEIEEMLNYGETGQLLPE